MNVYTIVLERIGTGEPSLSIVTRQDDEAAARAYAEAAIAQSPDLRVVATHARHFDASTGPRRAAWLDGRQQPRRKATGIGPTNSGQ